MVETHRFFGQNIADTIRALRGGDRKPKPEFPLNPEEGLRIEQENEQILAKEDFGRGDFEDFCKNMIELIKERPDPIGLARLRDRKAELDIDFNENAISVRGNPVATDDPHVFDSGLYEHISYSFREVDYGIFGVKYSDSQAILTTWDRVPVSSSITFFSYFNDKSESAFPKGTHRVRKEEKVSDKEVQDFCKRVYSVYDLSKVGL